MSGGEEIMERTGSEKMEIYLPAVEPCGASGAVDVSLEAIRGKGAATDAAQAMRQPAERFSLQGLQAIALCLGVGVYSSRGRGLNGEIVDFGMDFTHLKTWFDSRLGDYFRDRLQLADTWETAVPEPPGWVTLAIIVVAIWAFWEATKFPRHHSMRSAFDCIRMMVQMLGDILLIPVFFFMPAELTEVKYISTPKNERLLASCLSLWRFKQVPWFRNPLMAFSALMYYDFKVNDKSAVHRETLLTPDGGCIALDWWRCPKPGPNGKAKVLFIGSTWSGDALVSFSHEICEYFTARGWQCVVMVKRGSGLTMPNEQPQPEDGSRSHPWCLAGFEDLQLAIDHVAELCSGLPLCGVAPSLGASQLRNYINRVGSQSKLKSAVVVDAGEDWELCFDSVENRLPAMSAVLVKVAAATFDACGVPAKFGGESAREDGSDTVEVDMLAETVSSKRRVESGGPFKRFLRERMAPAHGFESSDRGVSSYLRSCQAHDPAGCKIPTLELLTFNDLLTDVGMISDLQNMHSVNSNIITCTTRQGTHIVRWHGIRGDCWISRVAFEFLEATLSLAAE
jgi:predicted alpha/beta-fold hydrolase